MIPVVMHQRGLSLQEAVDFVGEMCKSTIDRFKAERDNLPSWGPEIDRQVNIYVKGLADWMVGSLHWSFESTRYFGTNGRKVKSTRIVELLPLRPEARVSDFVDRSIVHLGLTSAKARAFSVTSRPPLPPVAIITEAPSSSPSTPTESEPVTPLDIVPSTPLSKPPASEKTFSGSPLPVIHAGNDIIARPNNSMPNRVLGRIQTESLPSPAAHAPTPASGAFIQPFSPEILSPAIGPLANQRIAKNPFFLEPFSLYSLTLWVFYALIYQPTLTLLRVFLNHDVHSHPFCHYEYM